MGETITMFETEVDVVCDQDMTAVNSILAFLKEFDLIQHGVKVKLLKEEGPAGGNPLVLVALPGKEMAKFLALYHSTETTDPWIRGLTTPRLPKEFLK